MFLNGLIVAPVVEEAHARKTISAALSPQMIREYLLLWDRVVVAEMEQYGDVSDGWIINDDMRFLASEGLLTIESVDLLGYWLPSLSLLAAPWELWALKEKDEPGAWTVANGEHPSVFLPSLSILPTYQRLPGLAEKGRGVFFRLNDCIPVPDAEVPLEEVIEFRTRRRDELLALRNHLQAIYQRIASAGDGPLALETELASLEEAIHDQLKITREAGFGWRLASYMEPQYNVLDVGRGGIHGRSDLLDGGWAPRKRTGGLSWRIGAVPDDWRIIGLRPARAA